MASSSGLQGAGSGRSGLLSISPHRVREISDPTALLLNQLHKVLFIDQLPPSLAQNHERALVERYKRSLFSHRHGARARSLKDELFRLLSGSKDVVRYDHFLTFLNHSSFN
ncbi:hypothetical protein T492DRAFT_1033959, partial [Pavlovales sp. CCMP2436]